MERKNRFGFSVLSLLICLALALMPMALAEGEEKQEEHKHDWDDWKVTTEATCTKKGEETRKCKGCDEVETREVKALGHDFGEWKTTKEAKCEEKGEETRKCSRCDEVETQEVKALEHDWSEWKTSKDATCTEKGEETRKCSLCDKEETRETDALGHDWGEWTTTKEAKCTEAGEKTRECSRCHEKETEAIEATGHSFGEWTKTKEAKCTEAGEETRTCTLCGEAETREIAALGHSFGDWTKTKEPKCTEAGEETRTCTLCGATETREIAALGHSFGEWTQTKAPTCTEAGAEASTCALCGVSETREIAALGHSFTTYTPAAAATCAGNATETAKCDRCDATDTREIAGTALGHDWGDPEYTWSEDNSAVTAKRVCKRDATHVEEETVAPEKTVVEATAETEGKITYTAKFANPAFQTQTKEEIIPIVTASVTITFDTDGGSEIAPVPGTPGAAVTAPAAPTKEGFAFVGWTPALPATFPEADLAVKAIWMPNPIVLDPLSSTYKPALDDVLKLIPTTAKVTLSDGTVLEATLVWNDESCPGYAEKEGDGEYEFTAATIDFGEGNPVPADAKATCTLVVAPGVKDGYIYRGDAQGEATIIGYNGSEAELIIPAELDGFKVVAIGDNAFLEQKKVTLISVPAGVRTIGNGAFAKCAKLTELQLPDSLTTSVPASAIEGSDKLKRLTLMTSQNTTLTSVTSFESASPVELPRAITDLHVLSNTLTIDSAYMVQSGESIIVEEGATLSIPESASLLNFGVVSNYGTTNVSGSLYTCGGTWTNNEPTRRKGGTVVIEHSMAPDSKYEYDVCEYCGYSEKISKTELTIKYTGDTLSKTYDKTRNVVNDQGTWLLNKKPTRSDFTISGYVGDYKSVKISKISVAKFDSADAGKYSLKVTFSLSGDDSARYTAKSATIPAVINKRPVVITPTAGLTKVYGTADPAKLGLSCSPKGLLGLTSAEQSAGKKLYTGAMTRQAGEDVGRYRFQQGTLDFGNKNYEVSMAEEYFTITQKSINQSDVGLVTIGNQKYTGKAITPEITLRYGTRTLKDGTDFKAEFTGNVGPGQATVKLTGIGNYTGTRQTTFNILKVSTDTGSGSSGSGSGTYTHSGFDTDDTVTPEADDDDEFFEDGSQSASDDDNAPEVGNLVLGEVDYGTVLFGALGDPMPFVLFEDQDAASEGLRTLTIIPDPMVDAATGEGVMLEGTERERYPELHLRLTTDLVQKLMQNGVTEIVYELEQADLHIPLASLVSEIPMPAPATEPVESMPNAGDDLSVDSDGMTVEEKGNEDPTVNTVDDGELVPETLPVDAFDFNVEQADATGLTERETAAMGDRPLIAPAYRVRVRVVPVGAAMEPTGLADENGAPVLQARSQELPEGFYLENVRLVLEPGTELATAPEGVETLYMSIVDEFAGEFEGEPQSADTTQLTPTQFTEADGVMVADIPVTADGLYAVRAPEDWDPSAYLADESGEFEDLEDGEAGDEVEGFEDVEESDDGFEDI